MTDSHTKKPMLLVLGDGVISDDRLTQSCRLTHMSCDMFFDLTRAEFDKQDIQLVVSALFSTQTDCIEIGQHLSTIGFHGTYLICTDTLPNPKVIKRELHQLYPDLHCLIMTPDDLIDFLNSARPAAAQ
ncbi:hypothetical protein [Aliiroseovarius sp. F47248L]|uniref:hypothetical protein n=1 Tax=Aliiroseovarius sp. F47248L TaxID=2926420 RepID=UPI001FF37303|nr:hypothetical protein [Aliiroseovarius sp. F47248L]MCK0138761.1 hypothetical protein [Aliiroseovarius sp. F47248L]